MPRQHRQLAAIMFTDIVGYTAMMGKDSNKTLEIVRQSKQIQKPLVEKHNGKWLKEMGDGAMAQFSSALDAVNCALEIQRTAKTDFECDLRIGIHLGDITIEDNDVYGDGVNVAARLESIADPGGIYISESIEKAIRGQSDVQTQYLGETNLKNVDYGVRAYAIQGEDFPRPHLNSSKLIFNRSSLLLLILVSLIIFLGYFWFTEKFPRGNQVRSIAVIPFDNLSNANDQEYFVEGMTITLISNLAKVSALKVIWYQDQDDEISISKLGNQIGVDAIISGAVMREGGMVRITARMIDVITEEQLWSETYDRDITSILKLHSEVAQAIVDKIQVLVTPDEIRRLKKAPEVNPEAYDLLLKGLFHLYKLTPDHYDIAQGYFNEVLLIDSLNAEAHAGTALVWAHKGQWGGEAPLIAVERSRKSAYRALELDSSLSNAHLAVAHIRTSFEWKWDLALESYKKSIELNPSLPEPRLFYADLLVSLHQNDEALKQINRALEADPDNGFSNSIKGWVLFATRQNSKAIEALNKSIEVDSTNSLSHRCLWSIYDQSGDYDLAMKHAICFYQHQNMNETATNLQSKFYELGYVGALKYAADQLEERTRRKYIYAMRVARLYTCSGDYDRALTWLEKAYDERYVSLFSLNVDRHWEKLHNQPRFLELLNKMNLTLLAD